MGPSHYDSLGEFKRATNELLIQIKRKINRETGNPKNFSIL